MTIKLIGAGFGRTGTSSLKAALEQLGFDKCYHMTEVFANPGHPQIWLDAAAGRPVDWDALFDGYQATVDWPGCTFYQELMQRYPDARVLLSVRDPQRWYESARDTIYTMSRLTRGTWLPRVIPRLRRSLHMIDAIIWTGTFHGRFEDRAYAIEHFNRHNQQVRDLVPPDRLLVYDVGQGWEPLCRFLDVPVPADTPFPHINDTATFRAVARRRVLVARLVLSAVGGAALLAAWLLARRRRPG